MTLKAKVLAKAAPRISFGNQPCPNEFLNGVDQENARLRPLIESLAEAVEALEKIEAYFCACSIDDEIIPQVVAREALAKLQGLGE